MVVLVTMGVVDPMVDTETVLHLRHMWLGDMAAPHHHLGEIMEVEATVVADVVALEVVAPNEIEDATLLDQDINSENSVLLQTCINLNFSTFFLRHNFDRIRYAGPYSVSIFLRDDTFTQVFSIERGS